MTQSKMQIRFHIYFLIIALAFAFCSLSQAQNKYILGSSSKTKLTKKKSESETITDLRAKAFSELKPSGKSYTENYLPSSATVSTQALEAKNPVVYTGLQLGLTYQNFQPTGTIPLSQIPSVNLSSLKKQALVGVELRYNPWNFDFLGQPTLGFRFGSSYLKQGIDLSSVGGSSLGDTQLQTIYSHFLLSSEFHFSFTDKLSWGLDVGLANLNSILSSTYTLANSSDQRNYQVVQTGPLLRTGPLWWTLNYQSRQNFGAAKWAQLENSSLIFGVLYGLR